MNPFSTVWHAKSDVAMVNRAIEYIIMSHDDGKDRMSNDMTVLPLFGKLAYEESVERPTVTIPRWWVW